MNGIHWKLERLAVRYAPDLASPLRWLGLAVRNRKQGRVRFMVLRTAGGGADRNPRSQRRGQSGKCTRETPSSRDPILGMGEERLSP
jgi:hypothetical protein